MSSSDLPNLDPVSMSAAVSAVLDDVLYNIVSDAILKTHREETIARMQSAAVLVQQARDDSKRDTGGSLLSSSPPPAKASSPEPEFITTPGAILRTADERIFLRGHPLATTSEILCPTCRLPRLSYPTLGRGARPLPDPTREYCARQPYISKEGCDIYGKSLVMEKLSKKKSAANLTAKKGTKDNDSRSGSESPPPGGSSPNGKAAGSVKPASTSIPSGKCPSCPRYLAFTRMAQHMDRCLGISGRQSSKAALSKLGSGTPRDMSRASTPKPAGSNAAGPHSSPAPGAASGVASSTASSAMGNGINHKKRKLERTSDDEGGGPGDDGGGGGGNGAGDGGANIKMGSVKKKKTFPKKDVSKDKAMNADLARVKGAEKRPPAASSGSAARKDLDD